MSDIKNYLDCNVFFIDVYAGSMFNFSKLFRIREREISDPLLVAKSPPISWGTNISVYTDEKNPQKVFTVHQPLFRCATVKDVQETTIGFVIQKTGFLRSQWNMLDRNHQELGILSTASLKGWTDLLRWQFEIDHGTIPTTYSQDLNLSIKGKNIGSVSLVERFPMRQIIVNLSFDNKMLMDRRMALAAAFLANSEISFRPNNGI